MTNFLMSNSDLFDKLYQEINRQNTFYFWIIGIVVAISIAISAFIGILQWRLSDKQIEKMKKDTIERIEDKYQLASMESSVSNNSIKVKNLENEVAKLKETVAIQKRLGIQRGYTTITELDELADRLKSADMTEAITIEKIMYRLIDEIVENKFLPELSKASTLSIVYDKLYYAKDTHEYANNVRDYMIEKAGNLIKFGQEFMNSPLRNKDK